MLSISTLHAVDYYTQDTNEAFAYYGDAGSKSETDPAGRWVGGLANRYFPVGQVVTPEHFAALFVSGLLTTPYRDSWRAARIASAIFEWRTQ